MPVPESRETLELQQLQLVSGNRRVMMFPKGHRELRVPRGMDRVRAPNGDTFHFNPKLIKSREIINASKAGRENDLLDLGPISKNDASHRVANGEQGLAVVERDRHGTEARAAAGTNRTAPAQVEAMERTKSPGHRISIEHPAETIARRGYADGGDVSDFDPDAYLASKSDRFDPDAWLASKHETQAAPDNLIDLAKTSVSNIPSSAYQFASDMAQPIIHPVETAQNIGHLARGAGQKLGAVSGQDDAPYVDALLSYFGNRYGGLDNFKATLANDPVGLAADLSMLLTGGETAAARLPGIAGRVGEVVGNVGRAIDPLNTAGAAAKVIGHGAAHAIGDLATQTGAASIKQAARAGYEGGEAARNFQENLRGVQPMEDSVAEARGALANIRNQRGMDYREGMKRVSGDPTVLDFDKIDNALAGISQVQTFKGQIISPKTQAIRQEIADTIRDWKRLDPDEFHTVEGFDALKQKLGDIRDATSYGTPDRLIADRAYQAVRGTILAQAPEYGRVMKGYEEASKQLKEIEKTLSLNPNANVDTSLRKLQSVLRDNVNTNYGQRGKLAAYLMNAGAPNLMNRLAGQALSSWTPRGLGKLGMQLGAEMTAAGLGTAGIGLPGLAAAAVPMVAMSPRLMGEAAYYAGKGTAKLPIKGAAKSAYLAGRLDDAEGSVPKP